MPHRLHKQGDAERTGGGELLGRCRGVAREVEGMEEGWRRGGEEVEWRWSGGGGEVEEVEGRWRGGEEDLEGDAGG